MNYTGGLMQYEKVQIVKVLKKKKKKLYNIGEKIKFLASSSGLYETL